MDSDPSALYESARSLTENLAGYVEEAFELRTVGLPDGAPGPHELMAALREVRTRVDRMEAILTACVRIRARAARASEAAVAVAQDSWDRASVVTRTRQPGRQPVQNTDFIAPRERYADANLMILNERRDERIAREVLSVAEESLEVIRIAHRGLDGLRRDLDAVLQAQRVERSIER